MKLLAIETATEACSAAVLLEGEVLFRHQIAPRQHTALILSMVDQLLQDTGLQLKDFDALAYGRGPGAFTGVRIATGVIQGLAYGVDLPVIPVSTLAALAQSAASTASNIISAIDARMGEIYWCRYVTSGTGLVTALVDEQVSSPDQILIDENKSYFGVGTGWETYQSELATVMGKQLLGSDGNRYPDARDILSLAEYEYQKGNTVSAQDALPVYIRNKVTG